MVEVVEKTEVKAEKNKDYIPINLDRDELSRFLGWGLPKNSLMLIEGEDGSGKSILVQRLAYSFLKNNYSVTYISSELNTISFIEQMSSLNYDVKKYLLDRKLLFIPVFPIFGNVKFNENFFQDLINNEEIFSKDIIIFDTISFIFLKKNIEISKWLDLIRTFKIIASRGKIIILCIDPMHLDKQYITIARSLSDIYFHLEIRSLVGEKVRVINIKRFKRPISTFVQTIPFRVIPNQGLVIEIATLE